MGPRVQANLGDLSAADLEAVRLSSQVLAHKAAMAGLPRVAMFFTSVESEAVVESAARGQRGQREEQPADPWRTAPLTPVDRAAIAAYLELVANNAGLSPAVRDYAARLLKARSAFG
ncbi:MAG: hypothetical protein ABI452_01570 [Candidatus Limnocylindrales bacterium]